jgi:hypothetical protein
MPAKAQKKFDDLKKKIADAQQELKATAKTLFKELSAEIFNENPTLVSFGWTQYTPYWNDGDTCTFSANTEYPTVTVLASDGKKVRHDENYGETVWLDPEDEEIEHTTDSEQYDQEIELVSEKVGDFLRNFSDEDLETMFGDHCKVTAERSGKIEVDGYDHE